MSQLADYLSYCAKLPRNVEYPTFKAFCAAWPFPVGTSTAQNPQEGTSEPYGDDNGGGLGVWVGSHPSVPQSRPDN